MGVVAVGAYQTLGKRICMEPLGNPRFGMTGAAQFSLGFGEQAWILRRMGQVAFETAADRSGTMQEVALRETFMAMGAEEIRRDHEA